MSTGIASATRTTKIDECVKQESPPLEQEPVNQL